MVDLHENIANNIIDISTKIDVIISDNGYESESDIVATPTGKRFAHDILSNIQEYALLYSEKEELSKHLTTLYKNQIIATSDDCDKAICANTIVQYIKKNYEHLGVVSFDICSFYRTIKNK